MADIINLRQKRKEKARSEKEKQAEANRQKHGRTKAEKKHTKMESEIAERRLEGHKRDNEEE